MRLGGPTRWAAEGWVADSGIPKGDLQETTQKRSQQTHPRGSDRAVKCRRLPRTGVRIPLGTPHLVQPGNSRNCAPGSMSGNSRERRDNKAEASSTSAFVIGAAILRFPPASPSTLAGVQTPGVKRRVGTGRSTAGCPGTMSTSTSPMGGRHGAAASSRVSSTRRGIRVLSRW